MLVRRAMENDILGIVAMAERFYPTSGYERIAPMTKESAAGLAILTMESGVMLVAEDAGALVGMACLHIEPYLFNAAVTLAQEIAWWIEPEYRGGMVAARLLYAAEAACRDLGAHAIRMATLPDSPPQAAAMFARMGYTPSENYFLKVL
jgi:N-acetylglutamate synthase-like GNAT family acetyltransferase